MKKIILLFLLIFPLFTVSALDELGCQQYCIVSVINGVGLEVNGMTIYAYTNNVKINISDIIGKAGNFDTDNFLMFDYSKLGLSPGESVYLTLDGVRSIRVTLPNSADNFQTPNITVSTSFLSTATSFTSLSEKKKKDNYEEGLFFSIGDLEDIPLLDGYTPVDANVVEKKKKSRFL